MHFKCKALACTNVLRARIGNEKWKPYNKPIASPYALSRLVSDIVKRLKGRSSKKLQMEFKELSKEYWGKHFGAIGYGVWSIRNVSQEMLEKYLEHHRTPSHKDVGNMMLE